MDVTMRIETSRNLTDEEAEAVFEALTPLAITDVVLVAVEEDGGSDEEPVT